MALGNGNPNNGNKGSNFNYELRLLELLDMVRAAVVTSTCCPTASTEATQLQVLGALQSGQNFDQAVVRDTGGVGCPGACPVYIQIRIFDTVAGTFDPPIYYDADGNLVVPVGPLEFLNPQDVLDDILVQLTAIKADTANLVPGTVVPGILVDSTSVIASPIPTGVKSLSILFRGTNGELDGNVVPDGYVVNFGNGRDTINTLMTYLRPTAGTGQEVIITTLS